MQGFDQPDLDEQPNPDADQNHVMMEVVDNLLALDVPNLQEAVADLLDGMDVDQAAPLPFHFTALPPAPQHPPEPPQYFGPPPPQVTASNPLTDDILTRLLARVPNLTELRIDRARHVMGTGILLLTKCPQLEVLVLVGCVAMKNQTLYTVLSSLSKLRVLHLIDMPLIGDPVVSAICTGPSRTTLKELQLTKIGRLTDPAVKQLVNACDSLESVHIADCPRITSDASSHLSCSLQMKKIFFRPTPHRPLTNRATRHFSCAASTLRSLKLAGCSQLTLNGIVALGNLPGLRQLHMRGLRHVSQDVMRQLGTFSKLDDLLLQGMMYLTDLGVKVLCGQRGHRYLHLALLDESNNLTDEALECVMTWCGSLRSLEVHGYFKPGALNRLQECIPRASLTVVSVSSGREVVEGQGGLWDRPMIDSE